MLKKLFSNLFILVIAVVIAFLWWFQNNDHQSVRDNSTELATVSSQQTNTLRSSDSVIVLNRAEIQVELNDSAQVNKLQENISVEGWVKDNLEQGIVGIQIEVSLKAASGWPKDIFAATTNSEGKFLIDCIPANDGYRLEVLASGPYLGTLVDPFPVTKHVQPVTITLDSLELVSVGGLIVDVDNSPVADFEFQVRNVEIAYPGSSIKSDSSGFFELSDFPVGALQFSSNGNEHFNINGIELSANEYQNLSLVIDKGNFYLSGRVIDDFGMPILQARVALTSTISAENYHSFSYRFLTTDSSGAFEFSGLGGQEHKLVVDASGYQSHVRNYQFQSVSDNLDIRLSGL